MKRFLLLLALLQLTLASRSRMKCLRSSKVNQLMKGWFHGSTSLNLGYPHNDYANRSVSPWQYRVFHDNDRFPSNIRFAECKFEGCIINGSEDNSFNSVQVFHTQMVLKRVRCPYRHKQYYLEVDYVRVPVACICVVPR